jgi:hypothetical protein
LVESVSTFTLRPEEEESIGVVGLLWLPRRGAAARSGESRFVGRLSCLWTTGVEKRQIGEVRCCGEGEDGASWPGSSSLSLSIDLRKMNVSLMSSRHGMLRNT